VGLDLRNVGALVALEAQLLGGFDEQLRGGCLVRAVTGGAILGHAMLELRLFQEIIVTLEAIRLSRFGEQELVPRAVRRVA
jgi:hypothetical protein